MELGENPELPRLDVTNASTKRRCKTTIERKWFKLQIQGTLQVTTANILVSEVEEAFSKICQIMKVDENRYQVLYPQRSEDGGVDFITLSKDAFLKDALMTFYLTCEEGSKLILTPISISKDHTINGTIVLSSMGTTQSLKKVSLTKDIMNTCKRTLQ